MTVEQILMIIRENLDAAIRNEQRALDQYNHSSNDDTRYGATFMQQMSAAQRSALQGVLDEIQAVQQ